MAQRIVKTREELVRAAEDILNLPEGEYRILVERLEPIRTDGQNKRHWVMIDELMRQINETVERVSGRTGYTPLEVKRLAAQGMPPEHIAILYARTREVVHEVLKAICGIPTSTRLGTKKFAEFDDKLEMVVAEVLGEVKRFEEESQ